MIIRSAAEYEAALRRLRALSSCSEDTPEEDELIVISLAIAVWETKLRDANDGTGRYPSSWLDE